MEDITTTQFESLVTLEVLFRAFAYVGENGFERLYLAHKASSVGNEILRDFNLSDVCRCQLRGQKVFLFHRQNRRIIAELALSADTDAKTGLQKRPQFYLMSRRGFIRTQPLSQLVSSAGRLGNYIRVRRNA